MERSRGKFIVIDGVDGSGKGTQIKLLQEKLKGHRVIFTREPGGTPKAEEIRTIILDKDGPPSNPLCDFFLLWAARASHIADTIEPARVAGTHAISDRFDSSTMAFQLFGEDRYAALQSLFNAIRTEIAYVPDRYIFLDLPAEVAYERRLKDVAQTKSKFDVRPIEYHERVRKGFQWFAWTYALKTTTMIDANRPIEEVHADIWKIVSETLGM